MFTFWEELSKILEDAELCKVVVLIRNLWTFRNRVVVNGIRPDPNQFTQETEINFAEFVKDSVPYMKACNTEKP